MARIQLHNYDRSAVRAGILHIGVGNFHRAHLEFLTNRLLECPDQRDWGICGVMLLPGDRALYEALRSQDNRYTLTVCGRDGHDEAFLIGSLVELYWAGVEPETILDRFADSAIRVITMTITEGGYNIARSDGHFMLDNPAVVSDLNDPRHPSTVFGYVAEGLRRRMKAGAGPVTILSCDNLQHNGDTARRAFTSFIEAQDSSLAEWVRTNVTFPNSMVDRITPATRPEDIARLNAENGTGDKAPVYTEDFIQWVVEDRFASGRPAWERVGAEFGDHVRDWERAKLSLLNASHTMLSYPSFLGGHRRVDRAMGDGRIVRLVKDFMDRDVTPLVPAPAGADLDLYKRTLLERFANRSVSDQVARLCSDGLSKFPVYIVPNLAGMVTGGADLVRVAFLIASYRHYLKYRTDDSGETFEISEPWMNAADKALIQSDDPADFLGISAFGGVDLKSCPSFMSAYRDFAEGIRREGAMRVLESIQTGHSSL